MRLGKNRDKLVDIIPMVVETKARWVPVGPATSAAEDDVLKICSTIQTPSLNTKLRTNDNRVRFVCLGYTCWWRRAFFIDIKGNIFR